MLRTATVVAAMFVASAALAACGGSSNPSSNSASRQAVSQAAFHNDAIKLAECMRTHGVPNFPDPGSGGGFGIQASRSASGGGTIAVDGHQLNVSSATFQRAMHECQKYAPQGPPISGAQLARVRAGAIRMAECMRSHGVPNFADPSVTTGPNGHGIAVRMGFGSAGGAQEKLATQSPAFQKAMRTCQPLMNVGLKAQGKAGN